uniref:Sushi domain containing 1 n=1 Tax=Poecilia latipinna TaxID=48699 RepID=A0A3B3VE31_9TELE
PFRGRWDYFTALYDSKTPVRTLLGEDRTWTQAVLDVCATCHPNATCEDKPDGSGKVCNCNYGFVGNGRTHCQDKDECQIGASKICGQHTTCHNTYGSYYCTCLSGYRPSNNMAVFIPNDGTHCRDIDECRITGQCGEGGQCRNLEGSFDCSCQIGYKVHNGAEPFRPQRGGAACKEILCGNPPLIEFTEQVWSSSSSPGSTVLYLCTEGFHSNGGHNVSVCGKNGQWTSPTLSCQEVNCGPPKCLPNTNLLWDGSSTPGSVARCECVDGFYQESGNDLSTCSLSGVWGEVSVKCKGRATSLMPGCCPLFDLLARFSSTLIPSVCHIRKNKMHRCLSLFKGAALRKINCFELCIMLCYSLVKNIPVVFLRFFYACLRNLPHSPPVNQLTLYNGNCLKWKVVYLGSRDYQRSFLDKGRRQLSSKGDRLIICLRLLPLTNYSISITAVAARFTATITANTSLTVPPAPVVHYTELETPVPTLRLKRSPNTLDPISFYQIFVLPVEELVVFDCSSPASLDPSSRAESPAEYLTAQLGVQSLGAEVNFTVGDGVLYGGFYNAPLQSGNTYFIVLRVVSRWKTVS